MRENPYKEVFLVKRQQILVVWRSIFVHQILHKFRRVSSGYRIWRPPGDLCSKMAQACRDPRARKTEWVPWVWQSFSVLSAPIKNETPLSSSSAGTPAPVLTRLKEKWVWSPVAITDQGHLVLEMDLILPSPGFKVVLSYPLTFLKKLNRNTNRAPFYNGSSVVVLSEVYALLTYVRVKHTHGPVSAIR